MYRIKYNDLTLYDPRLDDYQVLDANVHLSSKDTDSASMTIAPDHPHISEIRKMSGTIEILNDSAAVFRGRVYSAGKDFINQLEIECEGAMSYLADSIVPPFDFPADVEDDPEYIASTNVVEYFLRKLLDAHNANVSADRQIKLGTVTVADPNNYIARSSNDYSTTLETIRSKLQKSSLGGILMMRYEADGNYLDYLADYQLTNTQIIEFGENLIDIKADETSDNLYSIIYPIGNDGITIAEYPDGELTSDLVKIGNVIQSRSRIADVGKITKVVKYDDVTVVDNLISKASTELSSIGFRQNISVSAADLHYTDADIAAFRIGRYTRLNSAPHNFSALYPLTEISLNLLELAKTTITLGESSTTITDFNADRISVTESKIDAQVAEIEQNAEDLSDVVQTVNEQITSLVQTTQSMILSALTDYVKQGDFESYQNTVRTQLAIMAGQIEMNFQTVTNSITNVNGDLQSKYESINKYIRFVDGKIIIGVEGNELQLVEANDRVSFLQKGLEVAYISNNNLYIEDGEFLHQLKIGKFAFTPSVHGNLSFRKVGV